MMTSEPNGSTMPPASLSPELTARFLSAMQAAALESGEDELERRLRRLRPAPLSTRQQVTWLGAMQGRSLVNRSRLFWMGLTRWGAAAALFLLCSTGGLFLAAGSNASASGLARRCVMESRTGDAVQWRDGQRALRSCDVLYEDSFVLDGEEDSTITVRVPVRTQVLIEDEVI